MKGASCAGGRAVKLSEVAEHCTADDFWTAIDGVVYDMSGYAEAHPGGSIIMLAAGTDATVLFHQYHVFDFERAQSIVKARRIADLDGDSPVMGAFYLELRRRIASALQSDPKRPLKAKFLFFFDILAVLGIQMWSFTSSTSSSWWQLVLISLAVTIVLSRLFGQSHALGHMHSFGPWSVECMRWLLLALGAPGVQLFILPTLPTNPRRKLNESHAVSQHEFAQSRGPSEHVSVHHVVGLELAEDECLRVASVFGLMRYSREQVHRPWHRLQTYRIFQFLHGAVGEIGMSAVIGPLERVVFIWSYFVPQGLWIDTWCSLCGILVGLALGRAHLLICSVGVTGVCIYTIGCLLKFYIFGSHAEMYFAQHQWDRQVDLATANRDWGKHSAETAVSLRGMGWNPAFWGFGGTDPSTLTYHLEHSLFPGLSYLQLRKIAPLVQAACSEFAIEYRLVDGVSDLRLQYRAHLRELSEAKTD